MKPFPMLTHLRLGVSFGTFYLPSLSSRFLGGPSSGLQELNLNGVSPLALPSILSSTSDLVDLHLCNLPNTVTENVSPEVMVMGLVVMTKLKSLTIEFKHYHMHPPPAQDLRAQAILPTLTQFQFRGPCRYLEDLVAQLDTPQLFDFNVIITPSYPVVQQFSQLFQFIDCAKYLKLSQFRHAYAEIHDFHSFIRFDSAQTRQHPTYLTLGDSEVDFHNELRPMQALLSQASTIISSVRHLSITRLGRKWKRYGHQETYLFLAVA